MINDSDFGGFIVSKNVINGRPIRYTYREKANQAQLNGWTVYSVDDDDEYVNDSSNFEIVTATTVNKYAPVLLEIFNAPYGTDLCWLYEKDVHIGFYDLKNNKEVSVSEILKSKK